MIDEIPCPLCMSCFACKGRGVVDHGCDCDLCDEEVDCPECQGEDCWLCKGTGEVGNRCFRLNQEIHGCGGRGFAIENGKLVDCPRCITTQEHRLVAGVNQDPLL